MIIAIGADTGCFELKKSIVDYLNTKKIEVLDLGPKFQGDNCPFYEQAALVAKAIQTKKADKGIVICGTGFGVAITANKFKGIYAIPVDSEFGAEKAAAINQANIITLGSWFTTSFMANKLIDRWLNTEFTQGLGGAADFIRKSYECIKSYEDDNMK